MSDYTINELEETVHYLDVLIKFGSVFRPEIREALGNARHVVDELLSDMENLRDRFGGE